MDNKTDLLLTLAIVAGFVIVTQLQARDASAVAVAAMRGMGGRRTLGPGLGMPGTLWV